jgi:hypothetical protein
MPPMLDYDDPEPDAFLEFDSEFRCQHHKCFLGHAFIHVEKVRSNLRHDKQIRQAYV